MFADREIVLAAQIQEIYRQSREETTQEARIIYPHHKGVA
jgi:hypothetical protein